ncbi:MAG: hypothetical protein MSG64_05765 [Pyrinomonadaceae bacterium MAG19_C2-C3]|nr:hypothetical protein [Pyrinomonadaceae bacterium MAG19_C2-C3]
MNFNQLKTKHPIAFINKFILALMLPVIIAGCGSFTSQPTPAPTPQLSELERDLKAVRGPLILHIYLVARADGAKLTREDFAFINQNKPLETQEARITDDSRQVILGMNVVFPPEKLQALQSRFNVTEDAR